MGTPQKPDVGDEFPMSYEEFHVMLLKAQIKTGEELPPRDPRGRLLPVTWDPKDGDPCEAIFGHGAPSLSWPALSYENTGSPYEPGWMYDHLRGVAIYGCVGDWLEEHPEDDDEEECLS